jgi:hypothetical protein
VELPAWVWQYLAETAFRVQKLRATTDIAARVKCKKVPAALGFHSDRRNVFNADEAKLYSDVAFLLYESEGHKGITGDARIAVVADALGLTDTRTARRYVAKGRKWQRPPPTWAK